MPTNREIESVLMKLSAMLEFNDIRTNEQITDLFTRLDECKLSAQYLAPILNKTVEAVSGWRQGIDIPDEQTWPRIAASLREIIDGVIQSGWESTRN